MDGTFTLFHGLPLELRLAIWRHALSLFPRILHIELSPCVAASYEGEAVPSLSIKSSSAPTLLAINVESRKELFPFYTVPFIQPVASYHAYLAGDVSQPVRIPADIKVNLAVDTLFLENCASLPRPYGHRSKISNPLELVFSSIFGARVGEVTEKIERLALSPQVWESIKSSHGYWKAEQHNSLYPLLNQYSALQEFTNLKELSLMVKEVRRRHFVTGLRETLDVVTYSKERDLSWFEDNFGVGKVREGILVKRCAPVDVYLKHKGLLAVVLARKARAGLVTAEEVVEREESVGKIGEHIGSE